jgi:hypothetical protein
LPTPTAPPWPTASTTRHAAAPTAGPAPFVFGDDGLAVTVCFEEAFRNTADEAAVTLDHLPLRYLASGYQSARGTGGPAKD